MLVRLVLVICLIITCLDVGADPVRPSSANSATRRAWLEAFAARPLKPGPNPGTWVDAERWCVAHARLTVGAQTADANTYFAGIEPVSLWQGLVADTDVQVTDLLRTWFEFKDSPSLTPPAKARLESVLRGWTVPNRDRNRDADTRYEWPCEYTENHSLNILTAAYLLDAAFGRDRELHRDLLRRFLHDRAVYGWSEFHSPSYMLVTAKALACLVDFSPDPDISKAASMLLDLMMIQYAAQCVNGWRGVPFVRGYGSQVNNAANSSIHLARLWFAAGGTNAADQAQPFVVHLLTSRYEPPEMAVTLAMRQKERGVYTMRMTGVTGPEKQRVPMVFWISPDVTMCSAQGWGSYYDGCYWSISFASSPQDVITGQYGKGRNLVQCENVMVVFGDVDWRGGLKPQKEGPFTVGETDRAIVGQLDMDEDAHVLLAATKTMVPDRTAMRSSLEKMRASWSNGVVQLRLPDGSLLRMENERIGAQWRVIRTSADGREVPVWQPWQVEAPFMRSERDSGLYRLACGDRTQVYDFRDPFKPEVRMEAGIQFPEAPLMQWKGPATMEFVWIPAGEFPMGSALTEGRENERPMRWVRHAGYYMSRTEVTVGQYRQFLAESPGVPPPPDWYWKEWGKTDRHAMTWVSHADAMRFCEWMARKGGRLCRLPTESEWEKAAKGFDPRRYPWGDAYDGSQAGTPNGTYEESGTHPMDVSPFGVVDMAGGVWEWCGDDFDRAPPGAAWKSLRGCGWNYDPDTFRCAYRSGADSATRSVHIGFRVLALPPP